MGWGLSWKDMGLENGGRIEKGKIIFLTFEKRGVHEGQIWGVHQVEKTGDEKVVERTIKSVIHKNRKQENGCMEEFLRNT